jgi:hypothetical protein
VALDHDDLRIKECDSALASWRQGDYVTDPSWFAIGVNPNKPISDRSAEAANQNETLIEEKVLGFSVVSQSCDIVRSCVDRPFVEISPLVKIDDDKYSAVKNGHYPRYAPLKSLGAEKMAIDLDLTMTVEKSVLLGLTRKQGCASDEESRALALALSRKRSRFAFPEDFIGVVGKLQEHIKKKHGKQSAEGKALVELDEIRVTAEPDWSAGQIKLSIWFIKNLKSTLLDDEWSVALGTWTALIQKQGRYIDVALCLIALADMNAQEYVESDRLDLDHLSGQ